MRFFARFAGWWAGFSGLVAMGGGCPCCGGGVCVRGAAILGILGAAFATFLKSKNRQTETPTSDVPLQFASHETALDLQLHEKTAPSR